jgi:Transmembrane protein 43
MADSVSVTTSESWFSRLLGSIKSVLVGLLFFVVSFPLLFWNEARAVKTARSLSEGAGAVVSVAADRVDPGNEGKLVHTSGAVTMAAPVVDPDLGVKAQAIKLVRKVEMYQWREKQQSQTRKKLGGGTETVTTYTYDKAWLPTVVSSSSFREPNGHENPSSMPLGSATTVADPVHLGAFKLSRAQLDKLDETEPLRVDQPPAGPLSQDSRAPLKLADGGYYRGADPTSPQLGDVRIHFEIVNPKTVSTVGVQTGDTFAPYQASAGGTVLLVEAGDHGAAEMFKAAQSANQTLTWVLRAVGWLLMFFGLLLIFKPISTLGDVVPLVGGMLGAGLGLFSLLLASALSLVVIAIAWVYARPLLGIGLLVLAGAALALLIARGRKGRGSLAGSEAR